MTTLCVLFTFHAMAAPSPRKIASGGNDAVNIVTAYYKVAQGDSMAWLPVSVKLKTTRIEDGDRFDVVGYKFPSDFAWMEMSYGSTATKVRGENSSKYQYSAFLLNGYTVYFNLC